MVKFFCFKTRHWNCFLSSVATNGQDRMDKELKLEKIEPTFSNLNFMPGKITTKFIMVSASSEICLVAASYLYGSILCIGDGTN